MRRFNRLYGASPAHALGMLVCFAVAGYVASRVLEVPDPGWIALWLIGAVVAHDMVLFPFYSALDRLACALVRRRKPRALPMGWQNHLRVPVVVSGVLLLVSFPLVFRLSDRNYATATGLHTGVYIGRWLVLSACIFAASGVLYVLRVFLHRRHRNPNVETTGSEADT